MKAIRAVIYVGLAAEILVSPHASETRPASALEQERRNDERMWQLTRAMLVEFGYFAMLDAAWQKTMTPQQWASVRWPEPTPPTPSPAAQRVAARCAAMTDADFAATLQLACRETLDVRDVVTGLLVWIQDGGHPSLQGRHDLALHFVHAAAWELAGLGHAVSAIKEQLDEAHGKPFDLDDLAAGFAGAEWVRYAKEDPGWLPAWALGEKNLRVNLPALRYGVGPHSPETLGRIQQDIQASFARVRPPLPAQHGHNVN